MQEHARRLYDAETRTYAVSSAYATRPGYMIYLVSSSRQPSQSSMAFLNHKENTTTIFEAPL